MGEAEVTSRPVVVTVGLPYANGPLHIGHLRGLIAGDALSRGLSSLGARTIFVSGSDMHGTPIGISAREASTEPATYARRWHECNEAVARTFDVNFDKFGHTHDDANQEMAQSLVESLEANGHVVEREIRVAWDPDLDEPLDDRYVRGTCPHCGTQARGDECDDGCGRHLEPGDIEEPENALTGNDAEYQTRERKFLRVADFAEALDRFVDDLSGTDLAQRDAHRLVANAPDEWCISRELAWGVPYPDDSDDVLYVWVDALAGYLSMTRECVRETTAVDVDWQDLWTGDRSDVVHVVGRDIVQQHAVFWPAMLEGTGFAPPRAIAATGFVTLDGEDFSTSRDRAVWGSEYRDAGFDPGLLRYFLLASGALDEDIDFTWTRFQSRVNADLADTLDGFFQYTLTELVEHEGPLADSDCSDEVEQRISKTVAHIRSAVSNYRLQPLAKAPVVLARFGSPDHNDDRTGDEDGIEDPADLLRLARAIAVLSEPTMPSAASTMWSRLGGEDSIHDIGFEAALDLPEQVHISGSDRLIFDRITDEAIRPLQRTLEARLDDTE